MAKIFSAGCLAVLLFLLANGLATTAPAEVQDTRTGEWGVPND